MVTQSFFFNNNICLLDEDNDRVFETHISIVALIIYLFIFCSIYILYIAIIDLLKKSALEIRMLNNQNHFV